MWLFRVAVEFLLCIHVYTLDNKYKGVCGSSSFRLTRPDWNDIDLLARAVASGRVVDFGYKCSGNINDVTRFNWWNQ